jgi:hypothetical protein
MKKLITIVMLIVISIGCRDQLKNRGNVIDKGIDLINVKVMFDGLSIESDKNDKMSMDLYWIKLDSAGSDKIYVNLLTFEDTMIGSYIILGPEHFDMRMKTEY